MFYIRLLPCYKHVYDRNVYLDNTLQWMTNGEILSASTVNSSPWRNVATLQRTRFGIRKISMGQHITMNDTTNYRADIYTVYNLISLRSSLLCSVHTLWTCFCRYNSETH